MFQSDRHHALAFNATMTNRMSIVRETILVIHLLAQIWFFRDHSVFAIYILREIIKQLAYNYKSFGLDIISSEHINYHFILWNSK